MIRKAAGLRILYCGAFDISESNGPGINEREFVNGLARAFGERARFVLPFPRTPATLPAGYRISYSGHAPNRSLTYPLGQITQVYAMLRVMHAEPVDLLVFRAGPLPFGLLAVTRATRVPYAVKTLGAGVFDVFDGHAGPRTWRLTLSMLNAWLFRVLASRALAVDACTPELVASLRQKLRLPSSRVLCIANAIDPDRFFPVDRWEARRELRLDRFDPILGYVGGRPWERGGAQMVEIAPRLISRFPNLGITIVGGADGLAELRHRAQQIGVIDHCVFPGTVPYELVPRYIGAFDVGVSFDRNERAARIGNSSQKVRQYVAGGRPVIYGEQGNEFVQEHGLGTSVDPSDLTAVTNAVTSWLERTPEQRLAHERKAAAFARDHLTVDRALEQRLHFWHERLTTLRGEDPLGDTGFP